MKNTTFSLLLRILLFVLFAGIMLIKIALIQWHCIGILLFNPEHCGWVTYCAFWFPKIAAAMLVALPVFFCRRTWISVLWMLVLDFWAIANLIYFRANSLLLSLDAIRMAGNLDGYGSSILAYTNIDVWVFPLMTCFYLLVALLCMKTISSWKVGLTATAAGIMLSLAGGVCSFLSFSEYDESMQFSHEWLNPFITPTDIASANWQTERQQFNYLNNHSITAYAVNMVVEDIRLSKQRSHPKPETQIQEQFMNNLPDILHVEALKPDKNIIVILVESMESWTLQMHDKNGICVTEGINEFLKSHPHFYVPRITSEVKQGMSGDGLMTANTGLLPISSGAACLLYSHNTYPNYSQFYKSSKIVTPVSKTWNKSDAARNYGIHTIIEPDDQRTEYNQTTHRKYWIDDSIFNESYGATTALLDTAQQPFSICVLTISTHLPFDLYNHSFALNYDDSIPMNVREYLNCMHYTDHYLTDYLYKLEQSGVFDNTVIVITGDHVVFRNAALEELQTWAKGKPLSVAEETNYCPFIVFSPDIKESILRQDTCYQMDIFPTILALTGLEEYPWHGFGINLLGDEKRQFTEDEAYELSDLIIRSNAFASH